MVSESPKLTLTC